MRDFVLVFKTLYKAQNAKIVGDDGKKKVSTKVVLAIICAPILLAIIALVVYMAMGLKDIKSLSVFQNTLITATQMMCLFLMLPSILSSLYSSKDTPLLNSLPLRPTSVFFAKFALVYVNALKFSGTIIASLLLAVAITFNVVNKTMFYGFYPLILLIVPTVPLLPLFIVTLFSMPIVFIGSFFKGKSTLKTVFTLLAYTVIIVAYVVGIYFANTSSSNLEEIAISQGALAGMTTLANVMYPNKVLVEFCCGIDAGKNFGIWLGITVGMIAVMILLSLLFYRRINVKRLESQQDSDSKKTTLKQGKIIPTLMKRDVKTIMRNSKIAMSSLVNFLLAPVFIAMMFFVMRTNNANDPGEGIPPFMLEMMNIGFAMMYSMIFLGGANALAAMAYTREGASFFASKALPIRAKDSIISKLLLACIVPAIVLVPIMILMVALMKIGIVETLISAVDIMLVVAGVSGLNIIFDMLKGNQYWKDATELRSASKANYYQIISAFIAIIPAIAIFGVGVALSVFVESLGELTVKAIFFACATAISAIICVIGLAVLKSLGEQYYEKIGAKKPVSSPKNTIKLNNRRGFR